MKKTVCLILALILIAPAAVFAKGSGMIRFSTDVTEVERGQEFTLAVDLPRNPGVKVLRLTAEYNARQLELMLAEDEGLLDGGLFAKTYDENADRFVLYWSAQADSSAVGRLAKLHFRVKENAPVGSCAVSLTAKEWDCVDEAGERLTFHLPTLYLTIPCHHAALNEEMITPVSFAEAGLAEITCADCGEKWTEERLPSITSRDGSAVASVTPGDFSDESTEPTFSVQSFYAGAEYDAAAKTFGDRLVRVFRLNFTREGQPYVPKEAVTVRLQEREPGCALFALREGEFVPLESALSDGGFTFAYENAAFVLARKDAPAPTVSSTDPPPPSSTAPAPEDPPADVPFVLIGALILLVTSGAAIFFILRRRRV